MWTVIEKFYTPRTICSRFFIRRKYEKNFLTKYNYVVRMKTTDACIDYKNYLVRSRSKKYEIDNETIKDFDFINLNYFIGESSIIDFFITITEDLLKIIDKWD